MIQAGNRAYIENINIFKNNLVTRDIKLKLYYFIVRPVVTYGYEV